MFGFPDITGSIYLNAVLILAVFAVLAKALDIVVSYVFKGLARRSKTKLDDRIIKVVHRPVFLTVLVIGALQSVSYLGPPERMLFYTRAALYTGLVLLWAVAVIRISNIIIENSLGKIADITGLGRDVVPLVENVWKVVVFVAVVLVVLSIWKLDITPIIASAGIAGVAVALAAKDSLANFFGGISIYVDRPYKIGDYIVLEGGERGEVTEIGIRSTRIRTRDDVLISVPNSIISNTKIINESAPEPRFRVRIPIGVAYGSDIDLVEKTLLDIARGNENVVEEPEPRVRFRVFGDSSLDFELLCWIKEPALRGLTLHHLNSALYKAFAASGITIPFPQRDVHLRKVE
ncbi:MAG: mechanosensitive ion channel family protein [Nitrospirota bacterium]|jgi:small-conductance mechanosensitive channel